MSSVSSTDGVDWLDCRIAVGADGLLRAFNEAGVLESADVHVAQRVTSLAKEGDETSDTVALAVALAARALRGGSVCVDLMTVATDSLGKQLKISGRAEDAALLAKVAGKCFDPAPLPIVGGLIAETPDGSRRLKLSFDELLRLREDRVREILA